MEARNILISLAIKYNGDWHKIYATLQDKKHIPELKEVEETVSSLGDDIKALTILDKEYPASMRESTRPPFVLFYKGDISLIQNENIATVYGRRNEYRDYEAVYNAVDNITTAAKEKNGVVLTSGSQGISTMTRKMAISKDVKNIVVLAGGFNEVYPSENKELFNEVVEKGGLVMTEYSPKTLPERDHFPERMRIMSWLGKKTVVVDASQMSGTAVGVQFALSYGKDILVVPGPSFDDSLNNRLLEQGATPFVRREQLFD